MSAAAAIELLPDVLLQSPFVAISGFAVGIAVMFSFRAVSERIERIREVRGEQGLPVGLLGATGVDFLIDGVILDAGFAASRTRGALLTVALAVEYLFVGLSLSATLTGSVRPVTVAATPVALALLTVLGTVLEAVVLAGASASLLAGVLAFSAVAFMYLATEELFVQAHQSGETATGSVGFFLGFLIYLVLHELVA